MPDDVIAEFSEFKLKRTPYKYITYKIEGSTVVAAERIEKDVEYEDFTGTLDDTQCRFIVVDHEYKTNDGRDADKVVFISWCASQGRGFELVARTPSPPSFPVHTT